MLDLVKATLLAGAVLLTASPGCTRSPSDAKTCLAGDWVLTSDRAETPAVLRASVVYSFRGEELVLQTTAGDTIETHAVQIQALDDRRAAITIEGSRWTLELSDDCSSASFDGQDQAHGFSLARRSSP